MWTFGFDYFCNLNKDQFSQSAQIQSAVANAYDALRQMSYAEKGTVFWLDKEVSLLHSEKFCVLM